MRQISHEVARLGGRDSIGVASPLARAQALVGRPLQLERLGDGPLQACVHEPLVGLVPAAPAVHQALLDQPQGVRHDDDDGAEEVDEAEPEQAKGCVVCAQDPLFLKTREWIHPL